MEVRKSDGKSTSPQDTESKVTPELRKKLRQDRKQLVDENNKELERLKAQQAAAINHLRKNHVEKERAENQRLQEHIDAKNAQAQQEYQKAAEMQVQSNTQVRRASEQEKQQTQQVKKMYADERTIRQKDYEGGLQALDNAYKEKAHEKTVAIRSAEQQKVQGVQKEKDAYENIRAQQRDHYQNELEKEKKHYQGQIETRRDSFEDHYNENELKYQLHIADQQNKYQKDLEKKHDSYVESMQKYQSRGEDPFYKVKHLGAEMQETPGGYVVSLPVPEDELKNVKVRVQDDRITITGARKFEDEIKMENQKVATNNYQTIHQEFALPAPADREAFQRDYKDGMLVVTVPKRGGIGFI